MRWVQAGVLVLSVLALSGCPSEFGKEGRIGKAAHKDATDLSISRCSQAKIDEVCGKGREDTPECKKCLP
jgi:hypothetical protein